MISQLDRLGNHENAKLCLQRDRLYAISPSAARFRDITPEAELREKKIKIGLLIGAVILAIGTAVAIYYSLQATSTRTIHWANGHVFDLTESIAPIATIPAVFGGGGTIGLVIAAGRINCERSGGKKKNLYGAGAVEAELNVLTRANFTTVFDRYYEQNGGTQHLVRNGLIDESQGRKLSQLFQSSHELLASKKEFEGHGIPDLETNIETYPDYRYILTQVDKLEADWKVLQNSIKGQYIAV